MGYLVIVEFDGAPRGAVNQPLAKGELEQCVRFVSYYLPPVGYDFAIVSEETKRCVSYMTQPVRRRTRLTWAQVFNGKPFPI